MTKSVSSHIDFASSPCTKAAQKVSRKYNNTYRRRLQRREYKNLKKVLPAISSTPKVSKTDVIEEAIKYIDYLHAEIANRFYSGGAFRPEKEQSPVADSVKRLALHPQKTHPSQVQQSHPVFQFSPSFIEAGSQLVGPQFLLYQQSLKSTTSQTEHPVSSTKVSEVSKGSKDFGKTIQLRL